MGVAPGHALAELARLTALGIEVEAVASAKLRENVVKIPSRGWFGLAARLDIVLAEIPFDVDGVKFPLYGGIETVVDVLGDLAGPSGEISYLLPKSLRIFSGVMPVMAKSGWVQPRSSHSASMRSCL